MNAPNAPCPADGRLVALMDDEVAEEERTSIRRHLVECDRCGARFDELRRADRRLRTALTELDVPVPGRSSYSLDPHRGRRRMQWAAAAVIVLAVTLTALPLRGWVASLLGFTEPEAPTMVEEVRSPPLPTVTEMPVTGPEITLSFDVVPPGARLELARHGSDRLRFEDPTALAAVEIGADHLAVSPGTPSAPPTYRILVPETVGSMRVRLPGREDIVLNAAELSGVLALETDV